MRKLITLTMLCLIVITVAPAAGTTPQQPRKVSVTGLVYDLKHPDADRRQEAARLLGVNKVYSAVPDLMAAADDKDDTVRLNVLTALDQIRAPQAMPVYIKLTVDPKEDIRFLAINALVHLYAVDPSGFIAGTKKVFSFLNPFDSNYNELIVEPYVQVPPEVIQAMAVRLEDTEGKVRKAAVMTLGILRGRAALPAMKDVLPREPENSIKIEYIRSFYKIGDSAACADILPFINDPEKSVHDEAIATAGLLRCVGAVDTIMEIYESGIKERRTVLKVVPASSNEDLQNKCLQALAAIGDPKAKKLFIPALHHASGDFRISAAEGLARVADPDILELVEKTRQTAEGRRFQLALEYARYRLGKKEALGELVGELGSLRYSNQVFAYLMEFRPADCPDLFPYLRSNKGKIRIKLLDALGLTGGRDTLAEVETYTHDSDTDVVSAALNAVRRLQARIGQ